MNSDDLLRVAEGLARGALGSGRGRPRQVELRRAVSTAYYALFHALARCCADTLIGATRSENRSQPAWRQTYRALDHAQAKGRCNNTEMMNRFPISIRAFGETFVEMQPQRHNADYDPEATFTRDRVLQLIDEASRVITLFNDADDKDRRAFAAYVMFRMR